VSAASAAGAVVVDLPGHGRLGLRPRLPFVAMECCTGPDLYDFASGYGKMMQRLQAALGADIIGGGGLNRILCAVAHAADDTAAAAALENAGIPFDLRATALATLREHLDAGGGGLGHWSDVHKGRLNPPNQRVARWLPIDLARTIFLCVARGLLRLHQADVVHGDVKAENVVITGEAKLVDYGYMCPMRDGLVEVRVCVSDVRRRDSPRYISPEAVWLWWKQHPRREEDRGVVPVHLLEELPRGDKSWKEVLKALDVWMLGCARETAEDVNESGGEFALPPLTVSPFLSSVSLSPSSPPLFGPSLP
jgi:hypothetical protein